MRKQALFLTIVVIAACKPQVQPAAEIKTLDNFARADGAALTINRCGVNLSAKTLASLSKADRQKIKRIKIEGTGDTASLRAAAASGLTAVPRPVQTIFYGLGGSIRVTPQAKAICGNLKMEKNLKDFASEAGEARSCWRKLSGGVEVIMDADVDFLRHGMGRIFAYLYAEGIASAAKGSKDKILVNAAKSFGKERAELARAFLRDVESKSSFNRLANLASKAPKEFANFVLAEAIDSYYCTGETRRRFEKNFPHAFATFTDGSPSFRSDLGQAWFERK